MNLRSLDRSYVTGVARADLNVHVEDRQSADDSRIRAVAFAADEIVERGRLPIGTSPLGRPEGARQPACSPKMIQAELCRAIGELPIRAQQHHSGGKQP
jgi:3-phosphoglycerate kinase